MLPKIPNLSAIVIICRWSCTSGLCSAGLAPIRVAVRAAVVALLSLDPASLIKVRYLRMILFVG
jgi:hypothetical protein